MTRPVFNKQKNYRVKDDELFLFSCLGHTCFAFASLFGSNGILQTSAAFNWYKTTVPLDNTRDNNSWYTGTAMIVVPWTEAFAFETFLGISVIISAVMGLLMWKKNYSDAP